MELHFEKMNGNQRIEWKNTMWLYEAITETANKTIGVTSMLPHYAVRTHTHANEFIKS